MMFEHSWIEKQPRERFWISLSIAIALGMVALTSLAAFASYWTVDPVQEPAKALIDAFATPQAPGPCCLGGAPDIESVNGEEPLRLTANMTRPEAIHEHKIRYGEQLRLEGTAVVEAVIDEQGSVTSVRVLQRPSLGSDWAVVKAIQQWRFKPATLANKPVKVYYTLTVNFRIER
jgi:TonB family protein